LHPEKNLRNIIFGDVPVTGKLDALVPKSGYYDVVDYKTGDPANSITKIDGSKAPKDQYNFI
jgi:hypothetical protein